MPRKTRVAVSPLHASRICPLRQVAAVCLAISVVSTSLPAQARGHTTQGVNAEHAIDNSGAVESEGAKGPPDVVKLKDGAYFRGTISEYVPNDHVVLESANGETKRFEADEVEYAGPADGQESAQENQSSRSDIDRETSPQAKPGRDNEIAVRVEIDPASEVKNIEVHEYLGSTTVAASNGVTAVGHSFTRLCRAPCNLTTAEGTGSFGLSIEGRTPVAVGTVDLHDQQLLRASYTSRRKHRIAGYALMGGGLLVGAGIMSIGILAGSDSAGDGDTKRSQTPLYAGTVVMGVGLLVGFILMLQRDKAKLEPVEPGNRDQLAKNWRTNWAQRLTRKPMALGQRLSF